MSRLTYWVVFACFSILELFVGLIMPVFPMYYAIKFGFLAWCMAPVTQGASLLYTNFLRVRANGIHIIHIIHIIMSPINAAKCMCY
jgi:TB2/DP1, HVA22 family